VSVNGEQLDGQESDRVQNCWKVPDPPDSLIIKFSASPAALADRSRLVTKKLNLTDRTGLELLDLLGGRRRSTPAAQRLLAAGTVTQVTWLVPWPEVGRALATGRDLHSPLFQPLPIDRGQPLLRAILAGGKDKVTAYKLIKSVSFCNTRWV
jgi:hypothetical protein